MVILAYITKLLYPDIFADVDVEAFHRELLKDKGGSSPAYTYTCL